MAVYFIQNPDTMRIKIGKSFAVSDRLKTLSAQSGTQLELLGVLPGGINKERDLHLLFDATRITGIRKLATWARMNDDDEMVQALTDYALGVQ